MNALLKCLLLIIGITLSTQVNAFSHEVDHTGTDSVILAVTGISDPCQWNLRQGPVIENQTITVWIGPPQGSICFNEPPPLPFRLEFPVGGLGQGTYEVIVLSLDGEVERYRFSFSMNGAGTVTNAVPVAGVPALFLMVVLFFIAAFRRQGRLADRD